jgi:hypothetical protein
MLADEPWFARSGRAGDLLDVLARHGDRALEFDWKHRAALAGGAALAAFLAHPGPDLDGVVRLAGTAAGAAAAPATEAAREAARATNGTRLGLAGLLLLFAAWRLRRDRGGDRPRPVRRPIPAAPAPARPGRGAPGLAPRCGPGPIEGIERLSRGCTPAPSPGPGG